jgi:hypothetical protein
MDKTMKTLLLTTALLANTAIFANEEGEELHTETCVTCHIATHNEEFYTRENSKMHNHFELRSQVSNCISAFNVDWFPDEEDSVVDFLNTQYYKFEE